MEGGTTEETRTYRLQKEVLLYQIQELYAKQDGMMDVDCLTFQRTLKEWENSSQSQMMQWLAPFQPHIQYCACIKKRQNTLW
eukprot:4836070-Ditylum_brightwellii.AAC.1